MFNLGFPEIFMIGVLALLLFGPEKMPDFARTVARLIKEFKRMSHELQSTVHETVSTLDSDMPKTPSLKELYDRIDPKRAIEEVGVRPFSDAASGSVVDAPPALDAVSETPLPPLAMAAPLALEGGDAPTPSPLETSTSRPGSRTEAPGEPAKSERHEQAELPADKV